MKKHVLTLAIVTAAALGLGALSGSLIHEIKLELRTRAMRERVNQDLMQYWPSVAAYFEGRAAGYEVAATIDIAPPHSAEYLRGVGEAFLQAAELVARAEATGSTDPIVPAP